MLYTVPIFLRASANALAKGLDEANTARSSLRPTEKILATQRSNSVQIKLDDDLQSLVSALQSNTLHALHA